MRKPVSPLCNFVEGALFTLEAKMTTRHKRFPIKGAMGAVSVANPILVGVGIIVTVAVLRYLAKKSIDNTISKVLEKDIYLPTV